MSPRSNNVPRHSKRENGKCYAACPACRIRKMETNREMHALFLDMLCQTIFGLGFNTAMVAERWSRNQYEEFVGLLPPMVRAIALKLGDIKSEVRGYGTVEN